MATQAYSNIDSTTAIAAVLQAATAGNPKDRPFVRDISGILFTLKQRGFRFRDLGLRKIPGGFYSEDVENFVGQMLSMGYATQRSPIRVGKEGERFCHSIVEAEKNREELAKLLGELENLLKVQWLP
ncbi:MAG TPA: hypothetical protein VKM93_28610 [Terriglobia bacterium]|nr:hypothetical protein [Terriglobia bacterium]